MSTPPPQEELLKLDKELFGIPTPSNIDLPTASQLLELFPADEGRKHATWPPGENPVFWIKYGDGGVYWNEVVAQDMAYHGLQRLESTVRAPAVFYAFKHLRMVYLVMEYIAGDTAYERLEEAERQVKAAKGNTEAAKWQAEIKHVNDLVALSLSELHHIPIPLGFRPAGVDGNFIQHSLFYDSHAPTCYENTDQLEIHLNKLLEVRYRFRPKVPVEEQCFVANLSLEPMVLCQSDLYPKNFIIDKTGHIVLIDFADVSILPSSFAKCILDDAMLRFDIKDKVWIPTTPGVDNIEALKIVWRFMPSGYAAFEQLGQLLRKEWRPKLKT
ncbi:hypothetical protein PG989_000936 [Apiospora arundinis]